MAKIVQFPADFYDLGVVKFAAGSYHPLNSETQSLVTAGYAEIIDSAEAADHAVVLQALADMANARATAAMEHAEALAAEAADAQWLADDASRAAPRGVQAPAQPDAKALREAADALTVELEAAVVAFQKLTAEANADLENADLQEKRDVANDAGISMRARHTVAVAAAEAAEAALQA